ncbi:hypothetical protein I532_03945 [Brevibacillus borstelensis AK1]|uniref:Uncharacterized protein n=1 Tax=Brevibacillus borstelensis AK1 TaxID=1300222 RepID=M8DMM5_9BACL|nr:hypothetical protein [Brevibacillus borstelensis]EMT54727.1 hypothetical protein I532_03945 [Brevibacillus borstelensis AK1]
MPRYIGTRILTDTQAEADAINAENGVKQSDFSAEVWAQPYGTHCIGTRHKRVEIRYTGVRHAEYERHEVLPFLRT